MATLSRFANSNYGSFGSPFSNKMGQSYASGRSYLDPNRMAEREARRWDRAQRTSLANMQSGGGGRSGGGGFRGGPMGQLDLPPPMSPEEINDMAMVNTPGMGPQAAMAQARIMGGQGNVGDFGILQQRNAPGMSSDYNNAIARQRFRQASRLGYGRPGGLVGAAQQALFG
jgi:hypothetical protein